MKSSCTISVDNWSFDGKILTVHIPMAWMRRDGRKVIIAPEGSNAWMAAKPRPDQTLIPALARCVYIERRETVVAARNSGTGKTHVALGLGVIACQKGLSVGVTTAA